jgi:hypothetical protein
MMSAATDERLKILQMVEDGKISAEEATALLRAMSGGRHGAARPPGPGEERRYLRISVSDLDSGTARVNVSVPMGLVNAALRMAERFAPEFGEFDLDELQELIATSSGGKIIEVVDQAESERVEIYVE